MKDENDKSTIDLVDAAGVCVPAAEAAGRTPDGVAGKPKRLPRQSAYRPPQGAEPADGRPRSWLTSQFVVPVSAVARDWGISARRVRKMLEEGRLEGRQLENGYWEVCFPYRYVFGTRGPQIKRQRNLPPPTRARKKEDEFAEWKF